MPTLPSESIDVKKGHNLIDIIHKMEVDEVILHEVDSQSIHEILECLSSLYKESGQVKFIPLPMDTTNTKTNGIKIAVYWGRDGNNIKSSE